jgi:hypothetical protein
MTAASVLGVAITPARAAACRELLAGVASRGAWALVEPLLDAALVLDAEPVSGPDGVVARAPMLVHALASCALGSACARCSTPIEETDQRPIPWAEMVDAMRAGNVPRAEVLFKDLPAPSGEPLDDGWCCAWCISRQRATDAFRQRSATWLRRGIQLGLFGAAPARTRRRKARS